MKTLAEKIDEALGHAPASLREAFAAFDIVETEEVATATVAGRAVPVVKVNPRFVAEHCPTPQSLAALLMHEALHVVFGHTSRGGETTQLDNIVWDAVINSILCRMRPEPEWTALFTDLYSESDQMECFLRPVPGFDPSRPVALPPRSRRSPDRGERRSIARSTGDGVSRSPISGPTWRTSFLPVFCFSGGTRKGLRRPGVLRRTRKRAHERRRRAPGDGSPGKSSATSRGTSRKRRTWADRPPVAQSSNGE